MSHFSFLFICHFMILIHFNLCSTLQDIENFNLNIDNILSLFDDKENLDSETSSTSSSNDDSSNESGSFDFNDALNNLVNLDNKDCKHVCKKGYSPVSNPSHKPSSNGCGSFGIQLDTSKFPAVGDCCDAHDICYDTCGTSKKTCDNQFKDCLDTMCAKVGKVIGKDFEVCTEMSNMFYSTTDLLGCPSFLNSQKSACSCVPEHSSAKKPSFNTASKNSKSTSANSQDASESEEDFEDFFSMTHEVPELYDDPDSYTVMKNKFMSDEL